jgi:hypothetical protein
MRILDEGVVQSVSGFRFHYADRALSIGKAKKESYRQRSRSNSSKKPVCWRKYISQTLNEHVGNVG